jgi:NDP-sugar pyrophosphorylase family protein
LKVVILAGGLGTRLAEETTIRPKPMVEIGGKPVLWHIMKSYSAHGLHDFIICLGYKGYHDQGVLRQLLPAHRRTSPSTSPTTAWKCTRKRSNPGA